jgi:lipopolysaccharide/colanic/teichoic acid biosynthesis glycosyltransferase
VLLLLFLRFTDRALGTVLLVLAMPLLALLTTVVWLASGRRSPLVAHRRVGLHGSTFWMLKFRTMWPPSGKGGAAGKRWIERVESPGEIPLVKPRKDPRVNNRFAAWCRIHSLDELPQLWHVATGAMSLVGPRPLTEWEVRTYYGEPRSASLLSVRPGITGLWQVKGRNELTYAQRRRLDLLLVRKYGFALYVRILCWTLPRLLSGRGAW